MCIRDRLKSVIDKPRFGLKKKSKLYGEYHKAIDNKIVNVRLLVRSKSLAGINPSKIESYLSQMVKVGDGYKIRKGKLKGYVLNDKETIDNIIMEGYSIIED